MFGKWLKLVDTDGVQNFLKSTLPLPFSEGVECRGGVHFPWVPSKALRRTSPVEMHFP
jgi:hypothetical protein